MKRMNLSFYCLALFATILSSVHGAFVEIGTGTSDKRYAPVDGLYDYGWSQAIYLQSETSGAFEMSAISYHVANSPSAYAMPNQRIYMKHTSLTQFSDDGYDDPTTNEFALVFEGTVTWDGSGWHEITLDTPFDYNGTNGLIVYWQNRGGECGSGYPSFRYTSHSDRIKYNHDSTTFPTDSGRIKAYRPNVRFHWVAVGPGEAESPTPADCERGVAVDADPTLVWTNPVVATYNAVYFSTNETAVANTSSTVRVLYDGATLYSNYTHSVDLLPGITYYWKILESDASATTPGLLWSFTTEPEPIDTFPWLEDFEDGGNMPSFLTEEYVVGTHVWKFQSGGHSGHPSGAHGGTYNAAFLHQSSGTQTKLVMPPFDLSTGGSPQLSFWHTQAVYDGDQDELRVYYRTSKTNAWAMIPGAEYTGSITSWTKRTFNLPSPSATYYIAFEGLDDYGYGVCIDDVEISVSAYAAPTDLHAESIGLTTAELHWTAGGASKWNVEWGETGFIPGEGTFVNGITNGTTCLLDGLDSGTSYDFYVQDDYDSGQSSWSGPALFTTRFAPIDDFPWTEDFESSNTLPAGWSQEYEDGALDWIVADGGDLGVPNSAHEGSNNALFAGVGSDDTTKLVTRELDLSGIVAPQLSFWHAQAEDSGDQDELRVYYRNDTNGTWTLIPGAVFINDIPNWTNRTFALPSPGPSYFIAFEGLEAYGGGICLDDVRVYSTACPMPSGLRAEDVMVYSATLAWDNPGATNWNVEWGLDGFVQGAGTIVGGVTNMTCPLTNLTSGTEYSFYVQNVCSNTTSGWSGPFAFATLSGPITVYPWIEQFDAKNSLPAGWSVEFVTNEVYWFVRKGGVYEPLASHSASNNAVMYSTSTGNVSKLVSCELDLSGLTYPRLSFWHAQAAYGGDQDELRVYWRAKTNGAWSPISGAVYTNDVQEWAKYDLPIPSLSASFYLAFEGVANYGHGVCVDDVQVYDSLCPPPTDLHAENSTTSSVSLAWTTGGATNWNIEWGPRGFAQGVGTVISGTTNNPHLLTGLDQGTQYDFYVQDDRGGGDRSGWAGPTTFTTAFAPVTTYPWREDFENGGAVPRGWTNVPDSASDRAWQFDVPGDHLDPARYAADYDHSSSTGYVAWINDSDTFLSPPELGLVSPVLDLSGIDHPMLSFYYWIGHGDQQDSVLHVDVYGEIGWSNALLTVGENAQWNQQTLDLSSWTSAVSRIRFRGVPQMEGIGYQCDIALDDVRIFNCTNPPAATTAVEPTNGSVAVTFNGALLWAPVQNVSGYKLYLGSDNPPSNRMDGVNLGNVTSFNYTGLSFNTIHYWKVVPWNEGGGDAEGCPVWSFTTTEPLPIPYKEDFEMNHGGCTHYGQGDEWEWGVPSVSGGLNSGYNGSSKCWGTDLNNNYETDCNQSLLLPWMDLTAASDPVLDFWHIAKANGMYPAHTDPCRVEISTDGSTWVSLPHTCYEGDALDYAAARGFFTESSYTQWNDPPYAKIQNNWWRKERFSLASWTGQPVRLRFRLLNDCSYVLPGWYIDDVTINERYWTLTATADLNGTIEPAGEICVFNGSATNFVITPDTYWHVGDVTINSDSVGAVGGYTWTNVTTDGTIHATFDPDLAAQGTPHGWMADYGLTNSGQTFDQAETNNFDSDSHNNMQEFISDTDPTDSNDWFRVTSFSNRIVFFDSSNTRWYTLLGCTNLLSNDWKPVSTSRMGTGGADFLQSTNNVPQEFYKLTVELP